MNDFNDFSDDNLIESTERELVHLKTKDIEVMYKFAVTVVALPANGEPAALFHFGLAPLAEESISTHTVLVTREQFKSIMKDMHQVETMLENM